MTSVTISAPNPRHRARHRRRPRTIPFSRLVRVEWAKATDTRAARWLLALVALSTAGMMLAPVLAPTSFDQTYTSYLRVRRRRADDPPAGGGDPDAHRRMEPTQRPHHVHPGTATHPSRQRQAGGRRWCWVVALRSSAGWSPPPASGWRRPRAATLEANLTVGAIIGYLLFVLLNVLAGVALGALLQSSAAAIAASFALPAAFAVLGRASTLVADWIDMSTTWNWVLESEWAGHVPQILVSVLFWVAVPLAAGVVRTVRREIN